MPKIGIHHVSTKFIHYARLGDKKSMCGCVRAGTKSWSESLSYDHTMCTCTKCLTSLTAKRNAGTVPELAKS